MKINRDCVIGLYEDSLERGCLFFLAYAENRSARKSFFNIITYFFYIVKALSAEKAERNYERGNFNCFQDHMWKFSLYFVEDRSALRGKYMENRSVKKVFFYYNIFLIKNQMCGRLLEGRSAKKSFF